MCARVLNRDLAIQVTFIAFDVLRIDGESLMSARFDERRDALVRLSLQPPASVISETSADRVALFRPVCDLGLEGVVAKRLDSRYGSSRRGWVKTKNPNYWRRDSERVAMQCSREQGASTARR